MVHVTTKNKSFLRMAVLLHKLGVKNNKFFLALTQPELEHLDPWDKNLTKEQELAIAFECKINPWYFFREVIRIPVQGGEPVRYILNRANLALIWSFLSCVDGFITMPRQVGKTVGVMSITAWSMFFGARNSAIGMFAKDDGLRSENVARLKEIRNEGIPAYLIHISSTDSNNKEDVTYNGLKNRYKTFVAQSELRSAKKQGRGDTFIWGHWDETVYYKNIEHSFPSALAATHRGKKLARENGIPCSNLITTTAGLLDDPAGAYSYALTQRALRFTEHLYDLPSREELVNTLQTSGSVSMLYMEYSYKQLGLGEEWLKECTELITDQTIIDTDYLNKWISGSTASPVNREQMDKAAEYALEVAHTEYRQGIMLRWFYDITSKVDKLYSERTFILGADTSDNVGRDFSTLVLCDATDMSVAMTCKCNSANLTYFANVVVYILEKLPNCIFIPERNKNGAFIVDLLVVALGKKVFNRVFNKYVQNGKSTADADLELGSVRKQIGFNTGAKSRDLLYGTVLTVAVDLGHTGIHDMELINELNGLVTRNGRIDHVGEGHDDMVIAWLLCWYLAIHGRNMRSYNMNNTAFLNSLKGDNAKALDPIEKDRILRLKTRLQYIEKLAAKASNIAVARSYQREMEAIRLELPDEDDVIDITDTINIGEKSKAIEQTKKKPLDEALELFRELYA